MKLTFVLCILAACGGQPAPPKLGSGSSAPAVAPAGAEGGSDGAPQPQAAAPCEVSECGRPMMMPSRLCADGSTGGPTGECVRKADGRCGWEVRACP
jgi:hypothetical protein